MNHVATRALVERCLARQVGGLAVVPAKATRVGRPPDAVIVVPPKSAALLTKVCQKRGKHIRSVAAWLGTASRGAQITAQELNVPAFTAKKVLQRFIDAKLISIARKATLGCCATPTLYEKL